MFSMLKNFHFPKILSLNDIRSVFTKFVKPLTPQLSNSPLNDGVNSPEFRTMQKIINQRSSCRLFDSLRSISRSELRQVLQVTMRAPTAFNLQPWIAVIVTDPLQREALHVAALKQEAVRTAPVTIIFAGHMNPETMAPIVLENSLSNGDFRTTAYGSKFLRNVHYMLHKGPLGIMSGVKHLGGRLYSQITDQPMLTIPMDSCGYAWKQTIFPVNTFVLLATSAGWSTVIMEGFDEDAVRKVTGIPSHYTIPCIVSVGYPANTNNNTPPSTRLAFDHFFRWNRY